MTSLWCPRCKCQAPAPEWQRVMRDVMFRGLGLADVYKHRPKGKKCNGYAGDVRLFGRGKLATA